MKKTEQLPIPAIIHQIWSDKRMPMPEACTRLATTWQEQHPAWKYQLWGEQEMTDFVATHYPQYQTQYHDFPYDVQRWDAIRYLILYKTGGLYVDVDYEALKPIDQLLIGQECCFAREAIPQYPGDTCGSYIHNGLIACTPGHPFISEIIQQVFQPAAQSNNEHTTGMQTIFNTTGPLMVTRLYQQTSLKETICAIPPQWVTPCSPSEIMRILNGEEDDTLTQKVDHAYAIHYYLGTWIEPEMLAQRTIRP